MNLFRIVCLSLVLIGAVSTVQADDRNKKGVTISDASFRQISTTYLNDPLHMSAPAWARLILLYMKQTPNAAVVVLSSEELRWAGLDENHPYSPQLLAAYAAGNIQSQLNSGVKRNDRYSGLLTLFHVYRVLRQKDKKFKFAAVEDLLALHEEGKLVRYLQKLDEKKPAKLSPAEEQALRKLTAPR
jgi:hypothetical protein